MTRRTWLGRVIVWFVGLLLRRVRPDERWAEGVREAVGRGSPVFVLRHLSLIDFVALDHFLRGAGLPPIAFVYGLEQWFFRPFRWIFRAWMRPPRGVSPERHLARLIRRGVPVCIFLRRRPRTLELRTLRLGPRPLTVCVGLARRGVPVVVLPQAVVWGRRPPTAEPGVVARVLGPRESPGVVRAVLQALKGRRALLVRQSDPIELRDWLAQRRRPRPTARTARVLDTRLFHAMERERRAVLGPYVRSHARQAAELFSSARFQRELAAVAEHRKLPLEQVRVQAAAMLREIAARFRIESIEFLAVVFGRVWNRIYDGIEVDHEGLRRVVDAARQGSVILLPSHKSHIDYIVMSQVFYDARLATPFIAAGRNLSFWPLGPLFRAAGAFFMRRRFEGDELYVTVMRAYLRRLLLDGCHVELFCEGTRSRTGKLLPPRIGLLGLLVEAALHLRGRRIHVVPVSITHERVIEEGAHVRETSGGTKEKEDVGGLFGARRFLQSRYGRLHVRFGDPVDLHDFAAAAGVGPATVADRPAWRNAVRHLAFRSSFAVNLETPATPTALVAAALLGGGSRSVGRADLERRVARLRDWAAELGSPLAAALSPPHQTEPPHEAVRRAVELFASDGTLDVTGPLGETLVTVEDRRRPHLDYYRNGVLHVFLEPALVALGILAGDDRAGLPGRVNRLARLWKYEFIYADEADALPGVARGLEFLVRIGAVANAPDGALRIAAPSILRELARMLFAFVEAYRVALGVLERTTDTRRHAEVVARCLAEAERQYLRGELAAYEARNAVTFANVFVAARDLGWLEFPSSDTLRVSSAARSSEVLLEERKRLERLAATLR
ncbi:MAG: 1-acyl-sn-glycerol-3-phosphate acyltransferase [Deltaproteobacteria bacterium]|nr:1-acyl-sn-glycerol-3-phosphate acyltransferase [Deltaproteobacteria bacterium]